MKSIYLILIFFSFSIFKISAQCPEVLGAMVNACGSSEGLNEFVYFTSGATAGNVSTFTVRYGNSDNPPSTNAMPGNCATTKSGSGSITASGCTIIGVSSPSTNIPANSNVIFIPSSFTHNYNLTALCGGGTLYVVYINITSGASCNNSGVSNWQSSGSLSNSPSAPRYLQVTGPDSGCDAADSPVVSYSDGWSSNMDGNYVDWLGGSANYSNSGCDAPLPLSLLSFSANAKNKSIDLSWESYNSINVNRFEIEHSTDAIHFQKIGQIATNQQNIFNFIDENPVSGTNYYRLKIIDNDDSFVYSPIQNALFVSKTWSIFPNPAKGDFLTVICKNNSSTDIKIVDTFGKEVVIYKSESPISQLSIAHLDNGIYSVIFYENNQLIAIERFIKQL